MPSPDELLRKYEINYNLHSVGPISKVYLAVTKNYKTTRAVKVISKAELCSSHQANLCKALRQMEDIDHINVMKHFDMYEDSRFIYQVMEYCPGAPHFMQIIENNHVMSEDEGIIFAHKMVGALQYLHSKGIFHGDIKPENMLVGADNEVKLVDFGFTTI